MGDSGPENRDCKGSLRLNRNYVRGSRVHAVVSNTRLLQISQYITSYVLVFRRHAMNKSLNVPSN